MDFTLDNNVVLIATVYGGVVLAAFWLAMIIWAYRDMRSRSRDSLAQILVAVVVAVLTIPGLFIYIMLRPRETLSEAYERSLEEEALLQEIEEKPTCPGCGQRVQTDWQACPYCHTRLKKPCIACGAKLELSWNLCPSCATSQVSEQVLQSSRHVQPAAQAEIPVIPDKWLSANSARQTNENVGQSGSRTGNTLEFVEDEEY